MKKLQLHKEVIMNLNDSEMNQFRGGIGPTVTTVTVTTVFVPVPTKDDRPTPTDGDTKHTQSLPNGTVGPCLPC
jgi:hypothetical protein